MNIFLNEYSRFCFELYFELNHFQARFNEKLNFQNGSIFCKVIMIFANRAYHQYAKGYNFPIRTTQKISVSELWFIFRGSPLFLALLGLCHFISISTLNFGPFSTRLGGTVRAIKKMTQKDNRPGSGQNYGETGVFTFGRKVVFGLKMGLTPKNHPK